jgi:NADH-quinone oxidoreductase subunit J
MQLQTLLFWIFSIGLLGCGALVITRHNAIHSAMFLIQLFLCTAGLFLLLEAFLLAVVQMLVYAGAVMVLFLFVIMLLRVDPAQEKTYPRIAVFGATALAVVLGLEFYILLRKPVTLPTEAAAVMQGGLRDVLQPLFTNYLLPFELTALIVLVAMIGVVMLSKKDFT